MSNYATESNVREIVNQAVDNLSEVIGSFAQSTHNEIAELKQDSKEIRISIDRLTNTIDGFVARIDKYETELAARDNQFEKLLVWARKVSKKTGIPLDNL